MFKPLNPEFNAAVLNRAKSIKICLTADGTLCDSLEKITRIYRLHGYILVWTGASDKTIFGCRITNYKFRAWHDLIHIKLQAPFTPEGEYQVMLEQINELPAFKEILECEIMGQVQYEQENGFFPEDQIEFARAYMQMKGL